MLAISCEAHAVLNTRQNALYGAISPYINQSGVCYMATGQVTGGRIMWVEKRSEDNSISIFYLNTDLQEALLKVYNTTNYVGAIVDIWF